LKSLLRDVVEGNFLKGDAMNNGIRCNEIERYFDLREAWERMCEQVSSCVKGGILCLFVALNLWLILPIAAGWLAAKAFEKARRAIR
jgi:hypothetical protein